MDDDIKRLILNLTCTPSNYRKNRSQSCGKDNEELAPKLGPKLFEFDFEMSPLALSNLSENKKNLKLVINNTPMSCPVIKNCMHIEDDTTKCSSILQEYDLINTVKESKVTKKRLYECEDVFPKNTIDDDHDIQLIRAKKRFSMMYKKCDCPFTIIKDKEDKESSQQGRTILGILKKKSFSNTDSCYTHDY